MDDKCIVEGCMRRRLPGVETCYQHSTDETKERYKMKKLGVKDEKN